MTLDQNTLVDEMTKWRRDLHAYPEFGFRSAGLPLLSLRSLDRRLSVQKSLRGCRIGLGYAVAVDVAPVDHPAVA